MQNDQEKVKSLEKENDDLKKEVDKLKPLVKKLILSSNKLELILRDQKEYNNKAGIGYYTKYNIKSLINISLASKFSASKPCISNENPSSKLKYFKCGKLGHKSFKCSSLKITKNKVKRIWIPKGITATNLKGPKKAWVPKTAT